MDGWKDPLISIQGHILEGRIYGSQLRDKQMDQWTKGPTDRQTHTPTLPVKELLAEQQPQKGQSPLELKGEFLSFCQSWAPQILA